VSSIDYADGKISACCLIFSSCYVFCLFMQVSPFVKEKNWCGSVHNVSQLTCVCIDGKLCLIDCIIQSVVIVMIVNWHRTVQCDAWTLWSDEVVALYDYRAQRDDELSFVVNDVISVVDRPDGDWWHGRLHGNTGLFPSNYVASTTVKHLSVNCDLVPALELQRMYCVLWRSLLLQLTENV